MSALKLTLVSVSILLTSVASSAALHDRGNGMIFDDSLNVTWLQDWNHAKTSGHDADGLMVWSDAVAWADGLIFGGYSDWRLPTERPINGIAFQYTFSNNGTTDAPYARSGEGGGWGTASELGHLFYVTLQNRGFYTPDDSDPSSRFEQPGWGLRNTGPFLNTETTGLWSGTTFVGDPRFAWYFVPEFGMRTWGSGLRREYIALAVRDGDVTSAVPEPQTFAMLLAGIGLIAALGRRRCSKRFGA